MVIHHQGSTARAAVTMEFALHAIQSIYFKMKNVKVGTTSKVICIYTTFQLPGLSYLLEIYWKECFIWLKLLTVNYLS